MKGALAMVAAMIAATPVTARAEGEPPAPRVERHALEAALFLGGTYVFQGLAYAEEATRDQHVGAGGAVSVAYRGPYFLYPFVDVGFFQLSRSSVPVTVDPNGATVTVSNALSGGFFHGGAAVDLWRFRLRAGLGFDTLRRASVAGPITNDASTLSFASMLALGVRVVEAGTYGLLLEGRYESLPSTGSSFVGAGLTMKTDFLRW